ncbi:MAG: hydrogenase expression/formation protein [Gammaproteobacteria bacterium]
MKLKDIPIVPLGPGSQPAEEDGANLNYIDMPRGMSTYEAPAIPEAADVRHLDGARQAMIWLRDAIRRYKPGFEPLMADISALDDENRDLVNQILGDGDVNLKYTGSVKARVQESVLAGIWRTFYLDDEERVTRDLIEVSDAPYLAGMPVQGSEVQRDALTDSKAPDGVMNAMSILTEIDEKRSRYVTGNPAHVINLTLLPLSEEDIEFLDQTLGRGPVYILSRGYGDCHVIGTAVPNVWWVRYFNSMGKSILNSLEVVDVPSVVRAAPEDLEDSARRLDEILEPYWQKAS